LTAVAVLEEAVMCAPSLDLLDGQGKTAGQIARPSHTASVGGVKTSAYRAPAVTESLS
jgi:hypothetical protein